jgi:hypothetical protein
VDLVKRSMAIIDSLYCSFIGPFFYVRCIYYTRNFGVIQPTPFFMWLFSFYLRVCNSFLRKKLKIKGSFSLPQK